MRSLEKQLDKSVQTDGSGPALFALFVRRVKEQVHVVLAASPFGDSLRRSLARFPALLNCCTINWVHQWPDDALNFVSNKFLGDVDFGKEGGAGDDDDDELQDDQNVEAMMGIVGGGSSSSNRAKEEEREACIQLCEYFHNSTIALSKASRIQSRATF